MRDLKAVYSECIAEVVNAGIVPGNIVSVTVNTRAVRRLGQCRRRYNNYHINISSMLLSDSVPIEILKNTIIHEILHSCNGCMNHGETWLRLAAIMNARGYKIETTAKADTMQYIERPKAAYTIVCESCGHVFERYRMSDLVKNTDNYRCACGGKLRLK